MPYIPRPAGLTEEEEKLAERRQLLLSEDQEQRLKRSQELELKINLMQKKVDELSAANEGIRIENEGIRRENEDLRRMVAARRDELRFETPQESEAFEDQRRQEQVKESEVPEEKPSRSTPTEESSEKTAFQVMVKLMEGMQEIQKSMLKKGADGEKSGCSRNGVRSMDQ